MKILLSLLCVASSYIFCFAEDWPRTIETKSGAKIILYQPQPEELKGDKLSGRLAVSAREKYTDEPVFGAIWFTATMRTNRDARLATLESFAVNDVKLPGVTDTVKIRKLKTLLETEIPKWNIEASLDDLLASIEREQQNSSDEMKNDPPKILYTKTPSTLVLMDGEPRLQKDEKLNMQRVINTAFLIVQDESTKLYYFYGGNQWYSSATVLTEWKAVSKLPKSIQPIDQEIQKQAKSATGKNPAAEDPARVLIVSIEPAELIQSKGEADFAPIQGTSLLYMFNSENDIFMDINSQKYYVLLAGRWYMAASLNGPWTFVASDKLPPDFSKIPEGSARDGVLSSVAGTEAAREAVMDAQVPQTAKVDRKTATCSVAWDGEPKFEKITGTSLELGMNTSSTVMKDGRQYYCVENGVWFKSNSAKGPWEASVDRPKDTDKIPPESTAYNTKYVYIYDSTPDVIYVGYTPGYMGCYVYGSTVIYGTGYYYNPWYGPYYYPHVVTYGYSMHYNPWTGWSMGYHYSSGYFSVHVHGGYWGPHAYHPPYHPHYGGGMYGRGPTYINGDVNINTGRTNNIYNNRNGVSTRDVKRGDASRPTTRDTQNKNRNSSSGNKNAPSTRDTKNNVYTDKSGNVYQRNDNGNWQERNNNNQWQNADKSNASQMDKSHQQRERSAAGNQSFQQMNGGGNMGGSFNRGGGGGRRR